MNALRFAIADPPYLGRAHRWYGEGGRGSGGGLHRPDAHPEAAVWDDPARHVQLVADLVAGFDGWAIAAAPDSLTTYLPHLPDGTRVMVWHRRNAVPSGNRVRSCWEPVMVYTPPERRRYGTGPSTTDVLDAAAPHRVFAGAKPPKWTRWVLDAMGHTDTDELVDMFAGSGMVSAAAAQGVLL